MAKYTNYQKNGNNDLIDQLTRETQSLKRQYIQAVEKWAIKDFEKIERIAARQTYPNYADFATAGFIKGKGFNAIDYQQGKNYRKAEDQYYKIKKIAEAGRRFFVDQEIRLAERHYEDSIRKLAARIEKKGLNENSLKMVTSHIGVNIETVITDGNKTVKAFTILAAGMVNKPHYRYLIK